MNNKLKFGHLTIDRIYAIGICCNVRGDYKEIFWSDTRNIISYTTGTFKHSFENLEGIIENRQSCI